ncbi:MAG: hypothetical protein F6K17_13390 [Okeania sp. SIO3C4]|nr:hypothetical protein [Okeania sp. SIO3C4]
MKICKIIALATSLFLTTNQELYAGLFDEIKKLKIENSHCLECDVKIAEWENKVEPIIL